MNFKYLDNLITNCKLAKKLKPDYEFIFNSLSELNKISKAIYIIEEIEGNVQTTFTELKAYKNKNERKCPKLNKPSSTLYVGSSTTGLKKELKNT